MAEEVLQGSDVVARLQGVGGEGVAEGVKESGRDSSGGDAEPQAAAALL